MPEVCVFMEYISILLHSSIVSSEIVDTKFYGKIFSIQIIVVFGINVNMIKNDCRVPEFIECIIK